MDGIVIEFDLDLAKLAVAAGTGKIVTRNGKDVKLSNLFTVDSSSYSFYPIKGVIVYTLEEEEEMWTLEGKYTRGKDKDKLDLVIKEL